MGFSFSAPFANQSGEENGIESIFVKSISFGDDDDNDKTPYRSASFDREPMAMKSIDLETVKIKGSISIDSTTDKQIDNQSQRFSILDPSAPKHNAALKLQKVYKSFRIRRKLADCAVLVEQSWWKLLDFAELKRSSISFFDIEKHETAISRWSRARTRAAKVGKGLSKNDRAQKLALQHWLEAIDPRHRYGHNLHFYYVKWLHCQSREPFFYWLDIGEGREVNLVEKCPRLKLQQQCIKYLGPMERMFYEVVVEDGKFLYKQTGEPLHTTGEFKDAKWIFVLSTSKTLYVGRKKKGTFQHSSFLAGGATTAAGRLVVDNGVLKVVCPHSGHYRPTEENFKDFVSFLKENNVDLTDVKMSPVEEQEDLLRNSSHLRNNSSAEAEDFIDLEDLPQQQVDSTEPAHDVASEYPESARSSNLEIPRKGEFFGTSETLNGYESAGEGVSTSEQEEEPIPKESILQRINSHKGMKSYQLGKQLSCKWTTGAGPRIGCVRDYPAELQFRALEQVCLSPRSASPSRSSPKVLETSTTIMRSSSVPEKGMLLAQRSMISWTQSSSPLCREKQVNYAAANVAMIDDWISL